MPAMLIMAMVLLGAAAALGLLKGLPYLAMFNKVMGIAGSALLVALALGALGMPWLQSFIASFDWLYGLIVGFLGGSSISGMF